MAFKTTVTGRFVGGGLFNPRGDKDQFSACIVLDEGEEDKIEKIRDEAVVDKFGKKKKGLQDWTVRVGDDEDFEHSFERNFINPKNTNPVGTFQKINGVAKPVTQTDGIIYPGCFVAVSVDAFAYAGNATKKIKAGVTLSLRAVCFLKDGEPIGFNVDADEEFGEIPDSIKTVDEPDDDDDDKDDLF